MRRLHFVVTAGALALAGCASDDYSLAYRNPYHYQLTSPGAQFAALSPPVQNAIRAEAGMAEIAEISRDPASGRVDVYFVNEAIFPPLHIAPDGSVLGPSGHLVAVGASADDTQKVTGGAAANVLPGDLPVPVSETLRKNSPDAEIERISKEVWGSRSMYIITFKDSRAHPKLYILADGTILNQAPK